jgi:hypothetical protein
MKSRSLIVLIALLTLVPSVGAMAGRSLPPATQSQDYLAPNGIRTVHWDDQMEQLPQGVAMTFMPRPGDRSVRFRVEDLYGRNVLIYVFQVDPSGKRVQHEVCATTAATLPVLGSEPLEAYVYGGVCTNHTPAFATTGTLTARFSQATGPFKAHPGHH